MSDMNDDRRRHLRALVLMALADGSLGEREVNLVADRCAELGLSADDLDEAFRSGLSGTAAIEPPSSDAERHTLMKDLIRVMAADAQLAEPEKQLFALVAARLGMNGDDVDGVIDQVQREASGG